MNKEQSFAQQYWKENLLLIAKLLLAWAIITFGLAIFGANFLNQFEFFGVKFGFFLANQGSILFFILIIFIYIRKISKIEQKYSISE
ncbi:sodium/substrate symporter small subunit [Arcobacter vandammei]|uniref:sodium/substrate symporter small subunit n=1 Tax=Arcobacter vandammei TaxID=2782243 RepID=UPI0018DFB1EC